MGCEVYSLLMVLRCFGWRLRKGVSPMDTNTVIALCAIFSVVIAIVGISRK